MDGAITGDDADRYLKNVHHHKIEEDIRFLRHFAKFPAAAKVLDVGSGSGALLKYLAMEPRFHRKLYGVEISPELHNSAETLVNPLGAKVTLGDFLKVQSYSFDFCEQIVLSFFLHHLLVPQTALSKCSQLSPVGGKLFIYDRVLTREAIRPHFERFWADEYKSQHEWEERMPNLISHEVLVNSCARNGYMYICHEYAPHDHRSGCDNFRKTAYEFWYVAKEEGIEPCLLVHPMFMKHLDEIMHRALPPRTTITGKSEIKYSSSLIMDIYGKMPWCNLLAEWVHQKFRGETGVLLSVRHPELNHWQILAQMSRLKRDVRKSFGVVHGPKAQDGETKALFHAYHVPEPWELYEFCSGIARRIS